MPSWSGQPRSSASPWSRLNTGWRLNIPIPLPSRIVTPAWCGPQRTLSDYGIDGNRIAVGGASAGGGLAAGTALLARDRGGPQVAFQLLLEPMLDDRSVTFSSTQYEGGTVVWDRSDNAQGWGSLLGDRIGGDSVSPYAAPARATDLTGLPPTLIDVGEVETFRDECIEYARRLFAAGVPTELHVYPGAFHGFDLIAPDSAIGRLAWNLRWTALARALNVPRTA